MLTEWRTHSHDNYEDGRSAFTDDPNYHADHRVYISRSRYDKEKRAECQRLCLAGDPAYKDIDYEREEEWAVAEPGPLPESFRWQADREPFVQPGQVGYPYLFMRAMYGPASWQSKR